MFKDLYFVLEYNLANYSQHIFCPPWVISSPWRRGPVLDDPDGHVGERMLLTGQRDGKRKITNNEKMRLASEGRYDVTYLREDNSEIKPGPSGWWFSIGLVTQCCKKNNTQNPRKKRNWTDNKRKDQYTLQEDGTAHVWPNP
jgi:hypothetical protein